MAIEMPDESRKRICEALEGYVSDNLDVDIGLLQSQKLFEFVMGLIGASVYNQAIADAQAYFQEKTADLDGSRFEPEFGYWDTGAEER